MSSDAEEVQRNFNYNIHVLLVMWPWRYEGNDPFSSNEDQTTQAINAIVCRTEMLDICNTPLPA